MRRFRTTYGTWFWFVFDGFTWALCTWLGLYLRFRGDVPVIEYNYLTRLLPLSTAGLLASYLYCGVYRRDLGNEWKWQTIWWGWVGGVTLSLAILFFVQIPYSRAAFFVGAITFLGADVISRIIYRQLEITVFSGGKPEVLAVGFEASNAPFDGKVNADITFINSVEGDPSLEELQKHNPDFILVDGSSYDEKMLRKLHNYGSRTQIPVRIFPASRHLFFSRSTVVRWRGLNLLRSNLHFRFQQQMAFKTVFDYVVGSLLFIVLAPILLAIGLTILSIDGLPVIFKQERAGRRGNTFDVYKFRTMVRGASDKGPKLTEGADDSRITSLGKFLRRWSLDELPQLFNVLRGEMSLVGPRPELPSITGDYDPDQQRLLWLKPGLTGLSQVRGRQALGLEEKLEIDQEYLTNYSVGLDFWILLKTFWAVIRGTGAH